MHQNSSNLEFLEILFFKREKIITICKKIISNFITALLISE
ncbi:hypothetical protein X975_27153, partial [Stegodyphus mimosarum]